VPAATNSGHPLVARRATESAVAKTASPGIHVVLGVEAGLSGERIHAALGVGGADGAGVVVRVLGVGIVGVEIFLVQLVYAHPGTAVVVA
jgi:hypothetical protein